MPDLKSQSPPYVLLIVGSISVFAATVFAYTGKALVRFHGWVYRTKEPGWFWWQVALYFPCGVGLIAYILHLTN